MLGVTLVAAAALAVAAAYYLGHERLGLEGAGLALLRGVGLGALVLLVVNPSWTEERDAPPTVLLDASLSMTAAGGRFDEALDSALALAGAQGRVLRFGMDVGPLDDSTASDGATRVRPALAAARSGGGPILLVTDGEVSDAAMVPADLADGVHPVLLPRRSVPGLAATSVDLPPVVQSADSVTVGLTLRSWGGLAARTAHVEVHEGERLLLARDLDLPAPPATVRRRLTLPAGRLTPGEHVLRVTATADGDADNRDDERLRIVTVTGRPGITVVVDPADWEGSFLVRTLAEVAGTSVRAFARIGGDRWVDMRSGAGADGADVRRSVRQSRLVVVRGSAAAAAGWSGPRWHWPTGDDVEAAPAEGDWYVSRAPDPSPLTPVLARVAWDSLPPLTAVVPAAVGPERWIALTARAGRRGTARPVLLGETGDAGRRLITAGAGLWRWALRGGDAGEAYRTLVAAGVDWLLRSGAAPDTPPLTAPSVVQRGVPVTFRWRHDSIPDSLRVMIADRERDISVQQVLSFDAAGEAAVALEPGLYRWTVPDVTRGRGTVAVERYSDEYPPAPVTVDWPARGAAGLRLETPLRRRWWLFVLVVLAFGGEWAWRRRRGLP